MKKVLLLVILATAALASDLKSLTQDQQLPRLPLYMGIGYNIALGNPLSDTVDAGFGSPILKMTYNDHQTTQDQKYLIPDGFNHRLLSSCSFSSSVYEHRGTQSYQKSIFNKVTVGGGFHAWLVDFAFSASTSWQNMQKQTVEQKYSVTEASAECQAYHIFADLFSQLEVTTSFARAVNISYHNNNWDAFINAYGTHFLYDVIMGGRAAQQIAYSFGSVSQLRSYDINISASAKFSFAAFFGDTQTQWRKHTEEIKYSQQYSNQTKQIYVGGRPTTDGNIKSWVQNVRDLPMPIKYSLMDMDDLFQYVDIPQIKADIQKVKKSFDDGLKAYCQKWKCKKSTPDGPIPDTAKVQLLNTTYFGYNHSHINSFSIAKPNINVKQVVIRHQDDGSTNGGIYSLQIQLSNGVTSTFSPAFGVFKGTETTWKVPDGQFIHQVQVYIGKTDVDAIGFITNKGTRTPMFGKTIGTYHIYTVPDGYRVMGLSGSFADRIDMIGMIVGKTIVPQPKFQAEQKIVIDI